MRKLWTAILVAVVVLGLAVPALAQEWVPVESPGSAVDQFAAVKYIRNLSDLAAQYRDHGLSLQLDGDNYEWLIFSDSCVRDNIEAELVILGRSRAHIIDPLAWSLHVDMLTATINQIDAICKELDKYNMSGPYKKLVGKIAKKAAEGTEVLDSIKKQLDLGEERNYSALAGYGQVLWKIGNDLICLVKDLDYANWTAFYSGYLAAGEPCQNGFPACDACWDPDYGCGENCPTIVPSPVIGKECPSKSCGPKKCKPKCGKCTKKPKCGKCK